MSDETVQDLSLFRNPPGFRGRSAVVVQLWWLVQSTLFAWSPQFMFGWRAWLLRRFGAKIGKGVKLRPGVRVTYPWKLTIGDHCWFGERAHRDLHGARPRSLQHRRARRRLCGVQLARR